jgi:heme-degrading monooxygenase HmoA
MGDLRDYSHPTVACKRTGLLHSTVSAIFPGFTNKVCRRSRGDGTSIFVVLWEFEVKPGCEQRFERVYSPGGDWDVLFRSDPNHAGTQLFRDLARPQVYLTIDHWRSKKSYEEFRQARRAEYKALDAASEDLTAGERQIGAYETIDG